MGRDVSPHILRLNPLPNSTSDTFNHMRILHVLAPPFQPEHPPPSSHFIQTIMMAIQYHQANSLIDYTCTRVVLISFLEIFDLTMLPLCPLLRDIQSALMRAQRIIVVRVIRIALSRRYLSQRMRCHLTRNLEIAKVCQKICKRYM